MYWTPLVETINNFLTFRHSRLWSWWWQHPNRFEQEPRFRSWGQRGEHSQSGGSWKTFCRLWGCSSVLICVAIQKGKGFQQLKTLSGKFFKFQLKILASLFRTSIPNAASKLYFWCQTDDGVPLYNLFTSQIIHGVYTQKIYLLNSWTLLPFQKSSRESMPCPAGFGGISCLEMAV